mmetsp:Transcript_57330/g.114879  ORF Transcript_57330/g.114879 Transcript_57330/m.114879 type:complete len:216 (-) Transcript_57330:879-1526(-)
MMLAAATVVCGCAATRLSAMRSAFSSSPYCEMYLANSAAFKFAKYHVAGLVPRSEGSIRMSSGPSARKVNPRSGRSNWGDDTPRSAKMPSTRGSTPWRLKKSERARRAGASPKSPCRSSNLPCPNCSRRPRAASNAAGSRSMASTLQPGRLRSSASLWPPLPRVQSRITAPSPSPAHAKASTTSSSRTDTWWKWGRHAESMPVQLPTWLLSRPWP